MTDRVLRIPKLTTLRGLLASLLLGLGAMVCAQQTPPPFSPSNFDPSDVYFQGYLASRRAEQLLASGDAIAASEQFRKAEELFSSVRQYYPDWQPQMVKRRTEKNSEALTKADALAAKKLEEQRNVVAELEGGIRVSGADTPPLDNTHSPSILKVDPIASRRLDEAQKEVDRLRRLVTQQAAEKDRLRKLMEKQSGDAKAKLESFRQMSASEKAAAEAEIRRLRTQALLEKSRAESEIKRLEEITGDAQQRAKENIQRFKQLAESAAANAKKEVERMQQLSGKERQQAETEIQRLQKIANKATADAAKEVNQLKELSDPSRNDPGSELQRLREQLIRAKAEAEAREIELEMINANNLARINDLTSKGNQLKARLEAAESNASSIRSRLAKTPVFDEVKQLNGKIMQLEQERDAMSLTLRQTQSGYTDAMTRITGLEDELRKARQDAADLHRNLEAQQTASNEVVAGQRRQLEALRQQLDEKTEQLASAQEEIGSLKRELQESNDSFAQLRDERDALLMERDQMRALLKLNEGGRIQDLVEQNMSLAKKLRESDEQVERLKRDGNEDKDAITDALRDLAIAKSQINRLREEKRAQDERLHELEERLKNEEQALANGEASSDPAEVALLRDIIQRQLRVQERRRQASQLLLKAVKRLGNKDEQLAEAVELMESQEVQLTPEEQKLLAGRDVDDEFVSPFARSPEIVNKATHALNKDISVFERTARKSFIAGRLLPTRELYEMILDQNPGHTPTLCKIGVVHLKLKDQEAAIDAFQRAVELDNQNAYALRMLAYSLMLTGRHGDAEQAARESVKIEPNDDKTHMILATLCIHCGKPNEAESHFKGAINANPMPSEPYYNLALLYSSKGQLDEARKYYQQALERGALPDPQLEESLSIQ